MNREEFIRKAKEIHGDRYDYSKVVYINCKTKVCIICPEHGEFWQTPDNHYRGQDCPKCVGKKRWDTRGRMTTEQFIDKARKIHGNKYDYSKTKYVNPQTKICIICPEHGEFWQAPYSHLTGKSGCPKCKAKKIANDKITNFKNFVFSASTIHENKYIYDESTYKGIGKKMRIICPEHGEFWQVPYSHLKGFGCKKCGTVYMDENLFLKKAKEIHGNKYDYSKVEYRKAKEKVCIICPEHGEFWQTPSKHMAGQGCPLCKESHLEKMTSKLLTEKGIMFEQEKKFYWLNNMRLDFYLPDYNIAIECQGEQHFRPVDFAGKGEEWANNTFSKVKKYDEIKKDLCIKNNVNIEYILYNENIKNKLNIILEKYENNKNNSIC